MRGLPNPPSSSASQLVEADLRGTAMDESCWEQTRDLAGFKKVIAEMAVALLRIEWLQGARLMGYVSGVPTPV